MAGGSKRAVGVMVVCVVVAAFVVGLLQSSTPDRDRLGAPSVQQARERVAGAPPALRGLYAKSNVLEPQSGYAGALRRVRGFPVVVNVWASFCGPCRDEFPLLRRAVADLGSRVAFIGLNADTSAAAARKFLQTEPTLYPHFRDPKAAIAGPIGAGATLPSTIIYDRTGVVGTVSVGAYTSEQDLRDDLRRYGGLSTAR